MTEPLSIDSLLVLPHLRIQNANAISSPLTWGFPAITAFIGLMHALERRLKDTLPIALQGVGVVCHRHQALTDSAGFTTSFNLTRNPVDKTGATAAIVEEGRIHLDLTLVFGVQHLEGFVAHDEAAQVGLAQTVGDVLAGLRVAGGRVIHPTAGRRGRQGSARLIGLGDPGEDRDKIFRRERRRWLPGFALVSRDDLLRERLAEMRVSRPDASALDAWLDLARLNHHAERAAATDPKPVADRKVDADPGAGETDTDTDIDAGTTWVTRRPAGWIVPIPVGYGALSELHPPGAVSNARDAATPFRFVESLYSVGQWISPHRLRDASELLWTPESDPTSGLYRCRNRFRPPPIPIPIPIPISSPVVTPQSN